MKNLVLAKERCIGKTSDLIQKCAGDNYSLIVCPTRRMCEAVHEWAKEMNLDIPMPITFKEFINGQFYGKRIDKFYFDELQMSLDNFAHGVPIDTVVIDAGNVNITYTGRWKFRIAKLSSKILGKLKDILGIQSPSRGILKKDKSPSEFLEGFQDSYCHNLTEEEIKNGQVTRCKDCGFQTPNGICLIRSFVVKDRKIKEK